MSTQLSSEEKLVVFRIGNTLLGVSVDQVIEVFQPEVITPIPQAPVNLAGVINFRGQIIPIIDLAGKLQMQGNPDEENLYVIISDKLGGTAGILVDYVESVLGVEKQNIKATGEVLGKRIEDIPYLTGIAMTDLGLILILDLSKLSSTSEFEFFKELRAGSIELPKASPAMTPSTASSAEADMEFGLDFNSLKKAELVQIASELGISNPSSKSKNQLIELIKEKMGM